MKEALSWAISFCIWVLVATLMILFWPLTLLFALWLLTGLILQDRKAQKWDTEE
jgi:hypothetical protein